MGGRGVDCDTICICDFELRRALELLFGCGCAALALGSTGGHMRFWSSF